MKIDGTIYTTNTNVFVQKALPAVYKRISLAKGVEVGTLKVKEVKLPQLVPTKSEGVATRIDFDWIMQRYPADGAILCLHISREEAKRLKLKHSNGGSLGGFYNRNIGDKSIEFFIIADTTVKFVEKFTHELGHGLSHWSGQKDRTHEFGNSRLNDLYAQIDFTKWNLLTAIKKGLEATVAALKAKKPANLLHPVEKYKNYISQPYGTPNSTFYPLTGVHTGTDYATPVGTPVLAPWDGEVTISGTSAALGNFCHYKFVFDGVTYMARLMHLSAVPKKAKYNRGELIELSGKTGRITGPHLHIDIWYNDVRLDILTKKNWMNLTINPEELFK